MERKSRFTEKQKKMILVESVAIGDRAAAEKYGLNHHTLTRWRKQIDKKELDRAIEESGPFSAEFAKTLEFSTEFVNELLQKAIANIKTLSERGEHKAIAAYSALFKSCSDLIVLRELEQDSEDE